MAPFHHHAHNILQTTLSEFH